MPEPSKKWPLRSRVEVEWRDSQSMGRWDTADSYRSRRHLGPIRSIGYLLDLSDDCVSLIQSQSIGNGDVADCITIPREAVTRIRRVRGFKD